MAFRITGIRKPGGADNPHEAISAYRWVDDGKTAVHIDDRPTVVAWVDKGIQAYVLDASGNKAYCKVNVSRSGTRFLQTYADGKWTDNLLALPQC
jgi:hypothetical protein